MNRYEEILEALVNKVEGIEDKTWEDMCFDLNLTTHPDGLRKSFNGGPYSGYSVYKYFKEKEDSNYSEDEFERLRILREEVYKEKVKLSDQKKEYRNSLREDARYENLVEVLKGEICNLDKIETFKAREFANTGVDASLLLSDIHYGAKSDNVLNLYNTDVCRERMDELFKKVVYYCSLHKVQTLYINLLGDNISGLIHCGTRVEAEEDVVSQVIHVSELISNFIAGLTKYVPEIKIVGILGNHSRITPNKDSNVNSENFERMIFEYIKLRLPDIPMIVNGTEDWCSYKIGNRFIYVEHGDKCSISNIRQNCINLTGQVPDECYIGHYHHHEVRDEGGTVVIVNGSLMGVDSYAMSRRFNSKPSQVLRIYSDDVCTYNIVLE